MIRERKTNNNSYLATYDEVKSNEYNISIGAYIRNDIVEEEINIVDVTNDLKKLYEEEVVIKMEIDKFINDIKDDLYE